MCSFGAEGAMGHDGIKKFMLQAFSIVNCVHLKQEGKAKWS